MRAYGISVGILAAILVFSLWNSSYMTASTVRWREHTIARFHRHFAAILKSHA